MTENKVEHYLDNEALNTSIFSISKTKNALQSIP